MAGLENLTRGVQVKGVRNDGPVEVVYAKWSAASVIEPAFRDTLGRPGNALPHRADEARVDLLLAARGTPSASRRPATPP